MTPPLPTFQQMIISSLRLLDFPHIPDNDHSLDAFASKTFAAGVYGSKTWFLQVFNHLFHLHPSITEPSFNLLAPNLHHKSAVNAIMIQFQLMKRHGILPLNLVLRKSALELFRGDRFEGLLLELCSAGLRVTQRTKHAVKRASVSYHSSLEGWLAMGTNADPLEGKRILQSSRDALKMLMTTHQARVKEYGRLLGDLQRRADTLQGHLRCKRLRVQSHEESTGVFVESKRVHLDLTGWIGAWTDKLDRISATQKGKVEKVVVDGQRHDVAIPAGLGRGEGSMVDLEQITPFRDGRLDVNAVAVLANANIKLLRADVERICANADRPNSQHVPNLARALPCQEPDNPFVDSAPDPGGRGGRPTCKAWGEGDAMTTQEDSIRRKSEELATVRRQAEDSLWERRGNDGWLEELLTDVRRACEASPLAQLAEAQSDGMPWAPDDFLSGWC